VNGYLVEPGATDELAARVVEVLQDDLLRRRLSERAAVVRQEFSEEAFVARWSELFRDLDDEGWG
jgi:glycosyltransferase involved in cell wall biosynthesis